ncbi:uncharacterized protein LOC116614875 [Nematostella vectensis]|uniref:uncharacterized protein LOC116614875 n=1 Tax=Nematostella vectensis TaxID=45351 RepID=UPI0013900581|nr:uncharacterized protein LOC116614875 [Nematostella vectensis]
MTALSPFTAIYVALFLHIEVQTSKMNDFDLAFGYGGGYYELFAPMASHVDNHVPAGVCFWEALKCSVNSSTVLKIFRMHKIPNSKATHTLRYAKGENNASISMDGFRIPYVAVPKQGWQFVCTFWNDSHFTVYINSKQSFEATRRIPTKHHNHTDNIMVLSITTDPGCVGRVTCLNIWRTGLSFNNIEFLYRTKSCPAVFGTVIEWARARGGFISGTAEIKAPSHLTRFKDTKQFRRPSLPTTCPSPPPTDHQDMKNVTLNMAAPGHMTMTSHRVFTRLQCGDHCMRHAHCRGYNYQHCGGSGDVKICEIVGEQPRMLQSRDCFAFYSFNATAFRQILLAECTKT